MRLFASLAFAAGLAFSTGALAQAEGSFTVAGTNPGGASNYTGTVTVQKVGENVYQLEWTVGGNVSVGTAVGDDDFLSVGYKSGDNFGVALFVRDDDGWDGVWTYGGGKQIGTESWTPQ